MDDPRHDALYRYYTSRASIYEAAYAGTPQPWVQTMVEALQTALADRHVLELACGTGHWTSYAATVARSVTATVVVQQAYWRHGIGTRLLTTAEEWGRSKGACIALLDTYSESPISLPFYEQRMGYRRRAIHLRKLLG